MKISVLSAFVLVFYLCAGSSLGLAQDDGRVFYVKVTKGTELSGQIIGITEFKVTTGFGEVSIPVEKVEGIKMDSDGKGSAVIAFTNGDMVTGKIDMSDLQLKTNWGKAHINSAAIDSISSSQYGRFYSDPNGGGWRFSRGSLNQNRGMMRSRQPVLNGR